MMLTVFLGILAGAVLWMDRVFAFQSMASRPTIMGPLIGLVMGDLKTGMLVGLSLELLWLNSPPVGAYLPNDESFCAAVAVPVAVMMGSHLPPAAAAGLAVVLTMPFSRAGRMLDMRLRIMNEDIIGDHAAAGEKEISGAILRALTRAFILALAALCACVLLTGSIMLGIRQFIPESAIHALSVMPFACVVIGLAALVTREIPKKTQAGMFVVGLALVLLLTWMF